MRKYPDHEVTHLLLGLVLLEITGHWLMAAFSVVQVLLIVIFFVQQYLKQRIKRESTGDRE